MSEGESQEDAPLGAPATVRAMLLHGARELEQAMIPSARDEARVLLTHSMDVSTAWVLAHPEKPVSIDEQRRFMEAVERRSRYEPVAYITGSREFFGLELEVSPAVLVPRPETELLVEKAIAVARQLQAQWEGELLIVDVGTGSGAIALAVAVQIPSARVIAVDKSLAALEVAGRNIRRHRLQSRVELRHGDLLEGIDEKLHLLLANLPYIPSGAVDALMPDVSSWEPREALDGGWAGTEPTIRALEQAVARMLRPSAMLFEIGEGQGARLVETAQRLHPGAAVSVGLDYAGFERILSVEIGPE